jgi:HAD superfamily hydrolase (TIGR01509 family)
MIPKAVHFDCDGVVVDSEGPTFVMFQQEFAAAGLQVTIHDLETNWVGTTAEALAERARTMGADLPPDWVAGFYDRLNARLAMGVPLIPGILNVLDRLDAAGVPYAMGSNGPMAKMAVTLGQHGLVERFRGHVYSGQALGAPKPAPDVYLHASRALGVDPADCVVVEDSPSGALAARAAGIACFGYAPHAVNPGLVAAGARIFTDMGQLPGLLGL